MGILDNAGDITIDAVLTDEGRRRLARGDGSFKAVKFALTDDEIDYSLYNYNHPSGSAYFDLAVMQSPVLEAMTNNMSGGNSHLITYNREDLLFLPVIKLNEVFESSTATFSSGTLSGLFLCAVDTDTEEALAEVYPSWASGLIKGATTRGGSYIRLDQGLDTDKISPNFAIDADLMETSYQVEIDNRFGMIASKNSGRQATPSYIDDDFIASYMLDSGTDADYVQENTVREETDPSQTISGPRGSILQFRLKASLELMSSTYLFETIGSGDNMTLTGVTSGGVVSRTFQFIESIIVVRGNSTGFYVSVPVRFIKYTG